MKKILALTMVAMTLLLSACSSDYDRGYEEGYNNGYESGESDGYSEASSKYQSEMEDREYQISNNVEEVFTYLIPPEYFEDEVGTSYDDFMAYYSWTYENIYDNLIEYYPD